MRLFRARKVIREVDGLVDWMRDQDVRIGKLNLVTKDDDPIVVLIGLGPRAADLDSAFESLCPDPPISAKFDPPVALTGDTAWPRGHAFGFGLLDDGSYRFWLPRWLVLARWPFQGKRWRTDRKRLARLRALYWIVVRNYETELCERCGGPVGVVFHAPDDLWELASGYARFPDGESAPGCLCIKCVDDLVEPQVDGYLTWTCEVTR